MKLKIVNSGTKKFPFYQIMDGENEFCATSSIENAEKIVKIGDMFSPEMVEKAYWDGKENEASAGGNFDIENYR